MAQPLARDEQGNIWDISDPTRPRFVSHSASPLAPPSLPYEGPQAAANLQRSQLEVKQAEATAAATTAKTKAEAKSAEIAAQTAQEQWNINHPGMNGTATFSGPQYMHFLQQTNPGRAAYIQGLAEGRIPFPSAQMMRSPAGQALLTDVMRADPTIDATNYTTRASARKSAATGTLGASDNALITAVGHAARLKTLVPDVFGTQATPINSIANYIDANLFAGRQPAYDQNAQLLGDEVASAYGTNSQGKQNEAGAQFSSSLADKQKLDNIHGAMDLLGSKLAANRAQFAYGNGQLAKPDFMLLPAQTRQELMQIAPDVAAKYFSGVASIGGSNNQPPGAAPSPGSMTPPTGPTNGGPTASTDGFNDTPDPQSANFWASAARQQVPYRAALSQWQSDVKARGLVGITPPPGDAYQKASAFILQHPNVPYQPFSSITHTPVNPLQQAATNAAFSGPGVALGHAANAAAANLPTALAGDQGARYSAVSDAMHHNYAFGGDIAGTVAGAFGAQKALEGAAPFLGGYGKLIAGNPARAALSGDTAFFGGSGAAQNPDHPVLGAMGGMTAAIGGNALGRYVAGPVIRELLDTGPVQKGINTVGGMFGGPFKPPAALDSGQNMIFQRANPALDQITGKLQSAADLRLPYALADADPRLQALAGVAARKSPDALALANQVLVPRQAGQAERAIGQINNSLAPVGDVPTMQADILKQAQIQSAPLYADAKAQPVPDLTANPALKDVLDRPAGQVAIRKGFDTALNNGEDVGTLTYATDPDGNPVQYGNPSWNVIHYARQALDANGETATRRALDRQITTINPGFKTADAKYSSIINGSDALQSGASATGLKVTPEQAQAALASSNNTPLFQQGYASNMADQIERGRLSGNPYNLVNGSLGQQAKINAIFPQGVGKFNTAHALENDMTGTYREALGGSQTAARTEADKAFDHAEMASDLAMAPLTHGASLAGLLMTGARKGLGYLSDRTNIGMSMDKANSLAPYLLNPDPHANLLMLNNIAAQQAARKAYLQNFGAISGNLGAGMFGAPILYGASGN